MNAMLLVAAREFRQIAATRSFWITLLLLPLAIGLSQASARLFRPPPGVAFVVADASGHYAAQVKRQLVVDAQLETLDRLAAYAAKWRIAPAGAVWGQGPRLFTDRDVEAFETAGGLPAARAAIKRLKTPSTPDFRPPAAQFIAIDPPAGVVTDQGADRFGASLAPHLKHDVATPAGPRPLALGVYIPADFGQPGARVRMWTNGRPNGELIETVRGNLAASLQAKAMEAHGIDPATLARIEAITAPMTLTAPPSGSQRDLIRMRSALPLMLSYLLLMTLMLSGSWMLQGLIEERSNKLLESVLACISPDQLLYGKLIGVLGVGLTVVAVWIAFAVGTAFAMPGVVADFLRPALASVSSPWIALALAYFFLAGYLAISMLFLAVGAVSDSMRDAQGYLTPIILVITIPFAAIAGAVLQNPDGLLPRIMSWIPLYAPFAMTARLGGGVGAAEVVGSGALLAAFIALELALVSRLFRANLLQAGQPTKLADLRRRLTAGS